VVKDPKKPFSVSLGQQWTGSGDGNLFGKKDPNWGGFVIATDADTGQVKWRFRTMAPALSGVTPTKGGLVFVGDLATTHGRSMPTTEKSFGKANCPAPRAGVVSYLVDGRQKIALSPAHGRRFSRSLPRAPRS